MLINGVCMSCAILRVNIFFRSWTRNASKPAFYRGLSLINYLLQMKSSELKIFIVFSTILISFLIDEHFSSPKWPIINFKPKTLCRVEQYSKKLYFLKKVFIGRHPGSLVSQVLADSEVSNSNTSGGLFF